MWIRNTAVEVSAIFGSSYGMLYWYTSQMKTNEVTVFIDEPLLYISQIDASNPSIEFYVFGF